MSCSHSLCVKNVNNVSSALTVCIHYHYCSEKKKQKQELYKKKVIC